MAEQLLAPIMIGITGKRDLLGKDAAVRKALLSCFDLIDGEFRASRKLLLSGLAAGADTIAAELAIERGWKVIAVLPFELELFAQDFDDAGKAKLLAFTDPVTGSLADPAKGRVVVLRPLLDPETGKPFEAGALARSEAQSNPERADHYEQVGLFIAEQSALLIAIMPASEQPDRVGGTARIVEFRLHGAFDATAQRIVEQSQSLRVPIDLDTSQPGPIWLVDMDSVDSSVEEPLRSVELWQVDPASAADGAAITKVKFPGKKRLAEPLRLASRIDGFNKLANEQWRKEVEARARRDQQWQSEVEAGARPDTGDASSLIRQIRLALSAIQGGRKRTLTSTVTALAWLFVLAVLAIEIHLQFESLLALGAYVLFLVAMLIIFSYARLRMLQQYSEDYRAVAEALRVQLAWWDAGLTTPKYRVDRTYLCGTSGSLALVRAAARHLIEAALLEKPAPPASADDVKRWVGGQVSFFKTRTSERRKSLSRSEGIIWFLFIGSIGIAVFLLPLTMAIYYEGNAIISWINDRIGIERPTLWSWVMPWVAAALVLGLYAMARGVSHLADTSYHGRAQRRFIGGVNSFVAFAAGLAFAVGLYGLFLPPYNFGGAVNLWRLHPVASCDLACAQLMAHKVIAGSAVVIAAIAGAFRFYDERLASEAELHSYREALASFQRAQHELNRLEDDRSEWAARRREQILRELGIIALKENEAWIRAHRVRPLEPHL